MGSKKIPYQEDKREDQTEKKQGNQKGVQAVARQPVIDKGNVTVHTGQVGPPARGVFRNGNGPEGALLIRMGGHDGVVFFKGGDDRELEQPEKGSQFFCRMVWWLS